MADDNTLKILIQLGVIGQKDAEAVKGLLKESSEAASELARQMGTVTVSQADANRITGQAAEATEKEVIQKKELKEIIGKLTADYPLLGEVSRMALNPVVLAVAGPLMAFEIFQKRVESATDALSQVAMPDLTTAIDQAKQLGDHWKGIAESIAAANREFNNAEGVYKRTRDAIDAQADSDKKLLELKKQQALANLDLNKQSLTDDQYKIGKVGIENYYAQKNADVDQSAADKRMAARYAEKMAADIAAKTLADQASGFKLPESEAEFRAQQEAIKKMADTHRASSEKAREEAAKLQGVQNDASEGGLAGNLRAIPGAVGAQLTYGWGSHVSGIIKDQTAMAREADEKASAAEQLWAKREVEWKAKLDKQGQAADAAGTATRIGNELPFDRAKYELDKRTNAALVSGNTQINVDKTVAEITNGGHIAKLLSGIHSGSTTINGQIMTALHKMAADQNATSKQVADLIRPLPSLRMVN